MNLPFYKKALPHAVAFLIFIAITFIYLNPLLKGKELRQNDITQWKGMSKEIVDHRDETGEEPLWTNSAFGGMPAYQISAIYKANLIRYVDRLFKLGLPHPANLMFLLLAGFYFLLVTLRVNTPLAIAGAIAFAFSSYFFIIIEAGHNSKAHAVAYMAPVIAGILIAYRGKILPGAAITGLFLALQVGANHLQVTYYLGIIVLFFIAAKAYEAIKEKQLKAFVTASAALAIAAVLAIGPNITSILLTYEYGKESTRGPSELTENKENKTTGLDKDYATSWSYGIGETLTLMIPDFKGGASVSVGMYDEEALKEVDPQLKQAVAGQSAYFGDQPFTSGPVYVGAIICFLFILGLFIVEGTVKWWLLAATILSVMLAWGRHFMPLTDFFLDYVPGYNKFRTVAMTLIIAEFTMPLLAILALRQVILTPSVIQEKIKHFYTAAGLTAGLSILIWLAPGMFNDFFQQGEYERFMQQLNEAKFSPDQSSMFLNSLEEARKELVTSDAIRSAIFILLAAALLWLVSKNKIRNNYAIIAIGALILIDMWAVNQRYLNKENFVSKNLIRNQFPLTPADQQILQDKGYYRVFNLTVSSFNDATTSYYHKSIGGYHGAKLKRYEELIEEQQLRHQISKNNIQVLSMLNTKYFIVPDENRQPVVQVNPQALGAAWFVNEIKWVPDADAEIAALDDFDASQTAIVDERFKEVVSAPSPTDAAGEIRLTSYAPNHLIYEASAPAPQVAVFSEIYYSKGWNAYIDGKPVAHFRANYVLRGLSVPAGNHKIEFKFEPKTYHTGETISLASSILLLLLVTGVIVYEIKKPAGFPGKEK